MEKSMRDTKTKFFSNPDFCSGKKSVINADMSISNQMMRLKRKALLRMFTHIDKKLYPKNSSGANPASGITETTEYTPVPTPSQLTRKMTLTRPKLVHQGTQEKRKNSFASESVPKGGSGLSKTFDVAGQMLSD